MANKKQIAILASGNGSNAEEIIKYFIGHEHAEVALVMSNKSDAGVLKRADKYQIPTILFDRQIFRSENSILTELKLFDIDFIVLAGFLWLVPPVLVKDFPNRIVNIHPALLPKYGGKGMYGQNVHEAVISSGDKESGITIHYVNENYDEGNIIFQARVTVEEGETPESLSSKIHELEHKHFPKVIENMIMELS